MARKVGIIQAPDGFYIGSILKNGMLSAEARKITEQEIIAMFEDVLRRNKAETGRSVMTIFSKHEPVIVAKLRPTLAECGIVTPQQKAMLARQVEMSRMSDMTPRMNHE